MPEPSGAGWNPAPPHAQAHRKFHDFRSSEPSWIHERLVEHFLPTPAELALVLTCRGDANRCGMALLLKALPYLGYIPDSLTRIPLAARSFVAGRMGLLWDESEQYAWDGRTRDQHLFVVRQHAGWRRATAQDKEALEQTQMASATAGAAEEQRRKVVFGRIPGLDPRRSYADG